MARRRSGVQTRTTRGKTEIVVVQPSSSPARRRSSGGGIRRRRSSGRRRRSSGSSSGNIQNRLLRVAIGGAAYGLLVKNFPDLPRVPGFGRSGSVALAVYFLKPSSGILQDMGIAAAAIAGASFGESGTVSGNADDEVLSG